jgi:hypothetical protein
LLLFAKQINPNQSKKELNGTVILPPLVFPGQSMHPLKNVLMNAVDESSGKILMINKMGCHRFLEQY